MAVGVSVIDTLTTKRVLVGVTGGIAAYKSAELVRRLREQGAEIRVVMTRAACEFLGPLTLQALSGHPVRTELFDPAAEAGMDHIELARWPDLIVIAPASADVIARLAHGHADDLLTTICLASAAPLLVAPAMNQQMWRAAATQSNALSLRTRGVQLIGPACGAQACGESGPGRMVEPDEIVAAVVARLRSGALGDAHVLVTAGPTREPIDPVRYLSNRSSGRMGYALARAARDAGARVTLVSGPVHLAAPAGVELVPVTTAADMADAVAARIPGVDIFIGAAAVADYRPARVAPQKIKKSGATLELGLERTADILAWVAGAEARPFTVGFAAETENVERNARVKLESKRLDMIAANCVADSAIGFDADANELDVYWPGGMQHLARASKDRIARDLIALVADRYAARPRIARTEESRS
jgi:phosphopantothenoylcysteine decarboxylase/phosphopantothenate--cysteine ligase